MPVSPLRATALVFGISAAVVGGGLYARHVRSKERALHWTAALADAVARGALVLHVPHAPGSITLDGDQDDPGWVRPPGPAKTGAFLAMDGSEVRPYTEARFLWGDEYLYVALDILDEDVESHADVTDAPVGPDDDSVRLVFVQGGTEYAIDVSPHAVVTDAVRRADGAWDLRWNSGAHVSHELEGTINHPGNLDEGWDTELAIPLAALGLRGERGENVGLSLRRCDTPKGAARVCAGWGEGEGGRGRGVLVLE